MIVLLLFLQKQKLANAIYLFGLGTLLFIDLVFEKNLMRANAVDFKNCNVGVVDFVKPELVPVLVVINCTEGTSSGSGASMTAACAV